MVFFRKGGHAASGVRKKKALLWTGVLSALLVTIISHYPSIIKLSPKLDPSARIRGWRQLKGEIGPIYKVFSTQGPVLLFSDRYQISSELAFYIGRTSENLLHQSRQAYGPVRSLAGHER